MTVLLLEHHVSLLCIISVFSRLLQAFREDSLNVAVPMRMLEVFTSDRTYMPVLQDANCVTALIEQILHYMVQKGIIFNSRGNAYLYWVCVVLSVSDFVVLHISGFLSCRILQIAVCFSQSQVAVQSGVQWRPLYSASAHTARTYTQASALYIRLLPSRCQVYTHMGAH